MLKMEMYMKNFLKPGLLAALLICIAPMAAHAGADVTVTPAMQSCSSDADCTIADGQCGSACSFLPVNVQSSPALKQQKLSVCGAATTSEAACVTHPVLTSACINSRCTVGTAYQEHGSAGDYAKHPMRKAELPSTPAPSRSTSSNDNRHGFTAYDLPDQGGATIRSLGTMMTANR
jgi:hypothetical protein